jgi:hypothetical protein
MIATSAINQMKRFMSARIRLLRQLKAAKTGTA